MTLGLRINGVACALAVPETPERAASASTRPIRDTACSARSMGRLGLCLGGPNLDNFDICALVPVVEGAGGVITDWRGNPLTLASHGAIVAACSADLHTEALEMLAIARE